jgi:uncharacterized protein
MQQWYEPSEATLRSLFTQARAIAVVGVSNNPSRASNDVAHYLARAGYEIVPINPTIESWDGRPSFPDLQTAVRAGKQVDLVDVFRRPDELVHVVDDAIAAKVPAIWFQLGVIDEEQAARAQKAGITVVMDRCTKIDHRRLMRG